MNELKRIGLIVKEDVEAINQADKFETWLVANGVSVIRRDIEWPDRANPEGGLSCASPDLYCVFALGGDGTFLSAVRWIGDQKIPILGVKFGELGFLAETDENSLLPVGEAVLKGAFKTRPRMRLQVRIDRHGKEISKETVLNDVVINRGASAHLAHIQTYINEHFVLQHLT